MSDTGTAGSTRKSPRRPLTAVSKAPRKLRIAGIAGLIMAAGAVALVAAPAANAATANCPLPATEPWQYEGSSRLTNGNPFYINFFTTTYNGVAYNGTTETVRPSSTLTPSMGDGRCAPAN